MPQTESQSNHPSKTQEVRVAEALRANLRKRKEQQKLRSAMGVKNSEKEKE